MIVGALEARRYSYDELVEKVEVDAGYKVSKKSIQRYMVALKDAGYGIKLSRDGASTKFQVNSLPPNVLHVSMNSDQAASLHLASLALAVYEGTAWHSNLKSIFRTLERNLDAKKQASLNAARDRLSFSPSPKLDTQVNAHDLRVLEDACEKKFKVSCTYHASSGNIADQSPRHLPVVRMRNVRAMSEKFPGFSFNTKEHFKHCIGISHSNEIVDVVILFRGKIAHYVAERQWHSSQRLVRNSDGSITLSMRVARTFELDHLILRFGEDAEVLEPEDLRNSIASRLTNARAQYEVPAAKTRKSA